MCRCGRRGSLLVIDEAHCVSPALQARQPHHLLGQYASGLCRAKPGVAGPH